MTKFRDEKRLLDLKSALEARTYWLQRAEASKTRQEFRGCIAQASHVDAKIRKLDPTHKLRDKLFSDPNASREVTGRAAPQFGETEEQVQARLAENEGRSAIQYHALKGKWPQGLSVRAKRWIEKTENMKLFA